MKLLRKASTEEDIRRRMSYDGRIITRCLTESPVTLCLSISPSFQAFLTYLYLSRSSKRDLLFQISLQVIGFQIAAINAINAVNSVRAVVEVF